MGRRTTGSLITRGKARNYYLRWQHDGKVRVMRLSDQDGKPITRRPEAERAAERLMALYRDQDTVARMARVRADLDTAAERARRTQRELANESITLAGAFDAYLLADPARRGVRGDREAFDKLAGWCARRRPDARLLSDVTREDAAELFRELSETYSSGIVNSTLVRLRRLYRVLMASGRLALDASPLDGIGMVRKESARREAFTEEEIGRLLEAATGDMRSLIVLALNTGLRLKDCVTLRWDSVDLRAGVIVLTPAKTSRTSGTRVKIGLTPMLRAELESRLASRGDGEPLVYPALAERYRRRQDVIGLEFTQLAESCGIETSRRPAGAGVRARPVKSFHSLRHNYVSMCAEAGVPLAIVRTIVGHQAESMSEHYLHVSDAAAREMAERLSVPGAVHEEDSPRARLARLSQSLTDSQATRLLEVAARMLAEGNAPFSGEAAPTE